METIEMSDKDNIHLLTYEEVKEALPKGIGRSFPERLVDHLNDLIQGDEILRQGLRDNVLGYMHVLKEGKYRISDYVNAIKFVTYRLSGKGIKEAYKLTFPDRYKRLKEQGTEEKNIAAMATMYNKNQLVSKIMEQAMIPTWLLNQDLFQKAINTQAELMQTAKSEMVRMQAANSLLTHLKPPETSKVEVDMTVNQQNIIEELRKVTDALAEQQYKAIQEGKATIIDIAQSDIKVIEDKS